MTPSTTTTTTRRRPASRRRPGRPLLVLVGAGLARLESLVEDAEVHLDDGPDAA